MRFNPYTIYMHRFLLSNHIDPLNKIMLPPIPYMKSTLGILLSNEADLSSHPAVSLTYSYIPVIPQPAPIPINKRKY